MTIRLVLKPGERLFVNGAVLRIERRTAIELLNDATFLMEAHVMQAEDATTPLRRLYFIAQSLLIAPDRAAETAALFGRAFAEVWTLYGRSRLAPDLADLPALIDAGRAFDVLKRLRRLYDDEASVAATRETAEEKEIRWT